MQIAERKLSILDMSPENLLRLNSNARHPMMIYPWINQFIKHLKSYQSNHLNMSKSFAGKVVLISGGSQGIGRATAIKFAKEGASVAFVYLSSEKGAKETLSSIQDQGVKGLAIKADWGKVADIRRAFKGKLHKIILYNWSYTDEVLEVLNAFGHLDIFVNNAAVVSEVAFTQITEEEYDRVLNINTKGAFFSLQEAAKVVPNGGRIISISSAGTKLGIPNGSPYWASKVRN
jgi:3-oxoacyl-[acyl-carrier protein] reductase